MDEILKHTEPAVKQAFVQKNETSLSRLLYIEFKHLNQRNSHFPVDSNPCCYCITGVFLTKNNDPVLSW